MGIVPSQRNAVSKLRPFRVPFSSRSFVLQEEYRKQLAGNLLKDSNIMSKNTRILAFKNKPPTPPEGFERNARMLYSENAQAAGVKRSKIFRHIPQVNTIASSDCSLYTTNDVFIEPTQAVRMDHVSNGSFWFTVDPYRSECCWMKKDRLFKC